MDVEIEEYGEEQAGMKLPGEKELPICIYDLEPHIPDNLNLPRHNRFYQAKVDSRYLPVGEKNFLRMPELFMVTITNYDPFGYDYMMYTIENHCCEVPELLYNDGLRFVYFYTGGVKGGNKNIKTMLNYFRKSIESNATDEATKEIHEYISRVKISQEVQIDYMKYDDLVYQMKKEGYDEGKAEGKAEDILDLLDALGPVPVKVRETILGQNNLQTLRLWLKCAARAENLEQWKEQAGFEE